MTLDISNSNVVIEEANIEAAPSIEELAMDKAEAINNAQHVANVQDTAEAEAAALARQEEATSKALAVAVAKEEAEAFNLTTLATLAKASSKASTLISVNKTTVANVSEEARLFFFYAFQAVTANKEVTGEMVTKAREHFGKDSVTWKTVTSRASEAKAVWLYISCSGNPAIEIEKTDRQEGFTIDGTFDPVTCPLAMSTIAKAIRDAGKAVEAKENQYSNKESEALEAFRVVNPALAKLSDVELKDLAFHDDKAKRVNAIVDGFDAMAEAEAARVAEAEAVAEYEALTAIFKRFPNEKAFAKALKAFKAD